MSQKSTTIAILPMLFAPLRGIGKNHKLVQSSLHRLMAQEHRQAISGQKPNF